MFQISCCAKKQNKKKTLTCKTNVNEQCKKMTFKCLLSYFDISNAFPMHKNTFKTHAAVASILWSKANLQSSQHIPMLMFCIPIHSLPIHAFTINPPPTCLQDHTNTPCPVKRSVQMLMCPLGLLFSHNFPGNWIITTSIRPSRGNTNNHFEGNTQTNLIHLCERDCKCR